MLNYWDNSNKITTKGLQVQTFTSIVRTYNLQPVYEARRIATKSYSYIGMDEAAARACQAAKLAQYTRVFTRWTNENGTYYTIPRTEEKCVAAVSLDCDDADVWSVLIDVNEEQVQYGRDVIPPFDTSLDYDEDAPSGAYLRISSAYREQGKFCLAYEQSGIKNFAKANLVVENSADKTTWTAATPSAHTDGLITFNAQAWENKWYRLRWGDTIISNMCAPADIEHARSLSLTEIGYNTAFGAWVVGYSQDFANFDKNRLSVHAASIGGAFTDITDQCRISGPTVVTPYTSDSASFRIYVAYDGVTSNTLVAYNPAYDTGDGSFELQFSVCTYRSSSADWYVRSDFTFNIADFDTSLVTAKYSTDGGTWSDISLYEKDVVSSTVSLTLLLSQAGKYYVKFFYNGTQASNAITVEAEAEASE